MPITAIGPRQSRGLVPLFSILHPVPLTILSLDGAGPSGNAG